MTCTKPDLLKRRHKDVKLFPHYDTVQFRLDIYSLQLYVDNQRTTLYRPMVCLHMEKNIQRMMFLSASSLVIRMLHCR